MPSRKVGTPLSAEMPAPVSTTTWRALRRASRNAGEMKHSTCSLLMAYSPPCWAAQTPGGRPHLHTGQSLAHDRISPNETQGDDSASFLLIAWMDGGLAGRGVPTSLTVPWTG